MPRPSRKKSSSSRSYIDAAVTAIPQQPSAKEDGRNRRQRRKIKHGKVKRSSDESPSPRLVQIDRTCSENVKVPFRQRRSEALQAIQEEEDNAAPPVIQHELPGAHLISLSGNEASFDDEFDCDEEVVVVQAVAVEEASNQQDFLRSLSIQNVQLQMQLDGIVNAEEVIRIPRKKHRKKPKQVISRIQKMLLYIFLIVSAVVILTTIIASLATVPKRKQKRAASNQALLLATDSPTPGPTGVPGNPTASPTPRPTEMPTSPKISLSPSVSFFPSASPSQSPTSTSIPTMTPKPIPAPFAPFTFIPATLPTSPPTTFSISTSPPTTAAPTSIWSPSFTSESSVPMPSPNTQNEIAPFALNDKDGDFPRPSPFSHHAPADNSLLSPTYLDSERSPYWYSTQTTPYTAPAAPTAPTAPAAFGDDSPSPSSYPPLVPSKSPSTATSTFVPTTEAPF